MVVIYACLVLCLWLTARLFRWRRSKAELNFVAATEKCAAGVPAHIPKSGDTYVDRLRKEQKVLAELATKDEAEAKALTWNARCDRIESVRNFFHRWLSKGFGYVCGWLDMSLGTVEVASRAMNLDRTDIVEWVFYSTRFWISN